MVVVLLVVLGTAVHMWYYRDYLLDDAFILFRYAQNAARGWGLVFNRGERVEGYTSFLWVVWLWLWRCTGLEPTQVAAWTGRLAAAATVVIVGREARGGPLLASMAGPVFLGLNRSFVASASSGMETCLFAFLVLLALTRNGVWAWWLAGLASLVRPEGLLVVGFLLLKRGRRGVALLAGVPLLLHWAWRLWYYRDVFPNTFWAKVPWVYPVNGIRYLLTFGWEYRLGFLAPLILLGAIAGRRWLHLLFVAVFTLYVSLVGGDVMEFRFMVPILPVIAVLLADGCRLVGSRIRGRLEASFVGGSLLALVVLLQLPSLSGFTPQHGIPSLEQLARSTRRWSEVGRWLGRHARANEPVATTAAGAIPYYSGLPSVDMHGLCDRAIARLPLENRGRVGHERVASRDYLCRRGVAFLVGHPDLRRTPSSDPDTISVRVRRRWLQFTTCWDPDSLRTLLAKRGADVWSPDSSTSG